MSRTPNPTRDQPISYANAVAAALGKSESNTRKAPPPALKLEESTHKPITPPSANVAQPGRAPNAGSWNTRQAPSQVTRRSNEDIATYDWQEMSNLTLTDRSAPSSRYSPESEQSHDLPRFSPSSGRSPVNGSGSAHPRTPPSASSYGIHTPHTANALSPALHSGSSSHARSQQGGNDPWALSPQEKRFNESRYSPPHPAIIEVGRFLLISGFPSSASAQDICDLITSIGNLKALVALGPDNRDHVIATFYDTREAVKVYQYFRATPVVLLRNSRPASVSCSPVTKAELHAAMGPGTDFRKITEQSEARIVLQVIQGRPITKAAIQNSLEQIGEIKSIVAGDQFGFIYKAEFFDSRKAYQAVLELNGLAAVGGRLKVTYDLSTTEATKHTLGSSVYNPGAFSFAPERSDRSVSTSSQNADIFGPVGSSQHSRSSAEARAPRSTTYQNQHSFQTQGSAALSNNQPSFSRSTPPHLAAMGRRLGEPGMIQGLTSQADISARARVGQGLGGIPRNPAQAIPAPNVIFPERIFSGLDKRTSVMIKDVPNKLTRQGLIDILNEVVPGEYDFVYLRFDFGNSCNVGYAFVNFTNVKALYTFIQARVGKKWNLFSSEKVLQMSYANIQGKQNLINKFKNSSVMQVIEEWRPKIFYSAGAKQGLPEPFPPPDNAYIAARSTNARLNQLVGPESHEQPEHDMYRYEDQFDTTSFDAHYGF